MPNGPELNSVHEALGELKGQLREMVHATNNNSMKIDSLTVAVATQAELIRRVAGVESEIKALEVRILALEVEKHHRDGAIGLMSWLSRHWPFTLFATLLGLLVAWSNDKI